MFLNFFNFVNEKKFFFIEAVLNKREWTLDSLRYGLYRMGGPVRFTKHALLLSYDFVKIKTSKPILLLDKTFNS